MPRPAVIHWMSPAPIAAAVAHAVAVLDRPGQHIGDGLDPAMGMPGEAGQVVVRDVVAEIVEQQEGIEVGGIAEPERAAQVHAGAFEGGLGLDESLDGSDGHETALLRSGGAGSSSFKVGTGGLAWKGRPRWTATPVDR